MTVTYICDGPFSQKLIVLCWWQGRNARNVSLQTLYGGQFTLSTPLIKPNYLYISLNDEVEAFPVQNLPWKVQLFTPSMRTTLRQQNSVHIQRPAKFNSVSNEFVMVIICYPYHRVIHNSRVSSKREFTVCITKFIEILLITRVRATKNLISCDDQPSWRSMMTIWRTFVSYIS